MQSRFALDYGAVIPSGRPCRRHFRLRAPPVGEAYDDRLVLQLYTPMCISNAHKELVAMAHAPSRETVSINIRAKVRQRDLIDQAAERLGRSRSDFMLDAACREAEEVLLDQAFFTVDAGTFIQFRALLDRPLPPTDKLRRLLKAKAPWDK
jgi:uncharacterized protein (DUF1778 family)